MGPCHKERVPRSPRCFGQAGLVQSKVSRLAKLTWLKSHAECLMDWFGSSSSRPALLLAWRLAAPWQGLARDPGVARRCLDGALRTERAPWRRALLALASRILADSVYNFFRGRPSRSCSQRSRLLLPSDTER